jgi:hypothetical protein
MALITADILNEDCSDISDWTDNDNVNGVSEVSPAGQFRMDANNHANFCIASRYRVLSSVPNLFTLEISLNHTALGTIANTDYFRLSFAKTGWSLVPYFASDGLFIAGTGGGIFEVETNLVSTGTQQIWRFQVDCTTPSTATVEVFLNTVSQGTVDCSYTGTIFGNKYIVIAQNGQTTDNMLTHIEHIKIGTGFGEFPATLSLSDSFTLSDEFSRVASFEREFNDSLNLSEGTTLDPTYDLASIEITPYSGIMIVNSSQQVNAITHYNFSSNTNITNIATWSSSNPTVATIDSNGLIVALSAGISFIRVTFGSVSTLVMLQVEAISTSITEDSIFQQIPLTPDPNQTFSCTLLVDGKNIPINFQLRWNAQANYWVMTLINSANGTYYVDSIPLIAGVQPAINILQPYSYLKIGSCYIVNISGINSDYPTSENLGIDYIMLWGDTEIV